MDITPKTKKPMSKDEVSLLVDLITNNPVLVSKETNASTNKLKEEAWQAMTSTYNAKCGRTPRTKDQLKLKWDNMKKAARKRAANIRLNILKTGGGKADFIVPDENLDKVAGVLGSTCSGFEVPFGGDATVTLMTVDDEYLADEVTIVDQPLPLAKNDLSSQPGPSGTQDSIQRQNHYGMAPMPKYLHSKAKKTKSTDEGRLQRNLAIAKYYEKKREKLELEIEILKADLAEMKKNEK